MGVFLKFIGILLIVGGLGIIGFIYGPLVSQEIRYRTLLTEPENQTEEVIPQSIDFGLVIPRLGVNTQVFANVDPGNPAEYLPLLTQGVAHAEKSVLPGEPGNVFIFAHSADSPLNITRYNAVFYLINKLEPGDKIFVYYRKLKYTYRVVEQKIVAEEFVGDYFYGSDQERNLVLQTCHPPGTTINRLLVIAEEIN